ncbi:lytic polysaccharide monooxygenase [Melaminivora sp.]|uniref:lytic polysaccharide monooxygenase n=1 Tax=Melaminivora sp. TaxID=1933032 RepID=UPI0028B1E1DD|nr:lytic polysaccharide monooxygenase [Melaminivora sp.]
MEVPINRVYNCYKEGAENPTSAACREAKNLGGTQAAYDWNAISQNPPGDNHQSVVANGMLCSGGNSKYRGYDLGRPDWASTNIVPDSQGNYEFVYRATAPHATRYFKFYVTKNGWNRHAALTWADLEEFAVVQGTPPLTDGRYRMTVKLPPHKTGDHIIFNVWKRSDSEEAFYSCSDVKFSGGGGGGAPAEPPLSNPWKEIGSVKAYENLPAQSTATLRVFDAYGRDVERHAVVLDANTGMAANWPFALGMKVNAESHSMRIGIIRQTNAGVAVTPERSATDNKVYLNDGYRGYTFNVDIKKGEGTGAPPVSGDEWKEGVSYKIGQIVTQQGKRYSCLQAHTAYVGAGWRPSTTPALWKPL